MTLTLMKRLLTLALAAIFAVCAADAETYDVLEQVRSDWRKAAGMEGPHRTNPEDFGTMSTAPEGYRPFYISHYGRHGSRTAWNSETYSLLQKVLTKEHEAGNLTEKGEEFYRRYEDFYLIPYINSGDLMPLGYEQHKVISNWTYENFPEVFEGERKVNAIVSTSSRSIVSMASFCVELKGHNPKLDIYQESTHAGMCIAAPTDAPKQLRRYFKGQFDKPARPAGFQDKLYDHDDVLSIFFKNTDALRHYKGGKSKVCSRIVSIVSGYRNITDEPIFEGFIPNELLVKIWESGNFGSYMSYQRKRYGHIPLLEDVIAKSDAAIADRSIAANLRFGHDYVAEGLLFLINANGCSTLVDKAEDAKYWFQSYNIPMAATILFVFYENKKGDVIFKLVLNEHEATLPQLTPVEGCYYRWADFKAWTARLLAEHPELSKEEAEAAEKDSD